jgi:hypothetical protein
MKDDDINVSSPHDEHGFKPLELSEEGAQTLLKLMRESGELEDIYDDPYITHMLGYLSPEQWAEAISSKSVDKDWAARMMEIQEEEYNFDLISDVIRELGPSYNGLGGRTVNFEE